MEGHSVEVQLLFFGGDLGGEKNSGLKAEEMNEALISIDVELRVRKKRREEERI